jgi:hypothetical protein
MATLVNSRFLTTSVLIHLVAVSLVGSYVIFREVSEPEDFISGGGDGFISEQEAAALEPEPLAPQLDQLDQPMMPQNQPAAADMNAPVMLVTSSMNSATSVVAAPIVAPSKGNSDSTLPVIGAPGRQGGPKGLPGKWTKNTLYGAQIETQKLGVILDISGSAQEYLLEVVDEVDSKFKGAEIILFAGCGMHGKAAPNLYNIQPAERLKEELRKAAEEKADNVLGYLGAAMYTKEPNELQRLLKRMMRRDEVLVLVNGQGTERTSGGEYAFKRLIADDVDTVYWFADFKDRVTKELSAEVATALAEKKIKLVAHNFSGAPVPELVQAIVTRTGGQSISKVPGGRRAEREKERQEKEKEEKEKNDKAK